MERNEIGWELEKVMECTDETGYSSSYEFEDLWVLVTEGRTLIRVRDEEKKVYNSCLKVSSNITIDNEEHLVWVDVRFSFSSICSGPDIVYSSRIEKQNKILTAKEFYDAVWTFIDNGESFKGDEDCSPVLKKAIKAGADEILMVKDDGDDREPLLENLYGGDPESDSSIGNFCKIWGWYVKNEA